MPATAELRHAHDAITRSYALSARCILSARLLDGASFRRHEAGARAGSDTGRLGWQRLGKNGRHALIGAHHRQEVRRRCAQALLAVRAAHAATNAAACADDITAFRTSRRTLDAAVARALDTLHELARSADGSSHEKTRARLVALYARWQRRLDDIELALAAWR
jgi:hypothetical protein